MVKAKVEIRNLTGLHLRPAGILCNKAIQFKSKIHFQVRDTTANAKSVLSVLGACVKCGDEITFICEGEDEKEALDSMIKVVSNGLVVTDASHMIGMFGATVPRSEQVPGAIAAGCDMFLFFNDREEDFGYMMEGYKNGTITEERLNDALHRILGLKAALNLHIHKKEGTLMPPKEGLSVVGCPEHHQIAAQIADQYVTLVKDRENYLPMTPEKYKRIKLVFIGGEGRVIAGQLLKGNDEVIKADVIHQLEEAGFEVDAEEPVLKGKMEEFKKRFDAVLLILSVEGFAQYNVMRVKWNLPIKQPWYMSEVPTIVASLTYPNMLIDVPMARCYANAYMNHPEAVHALIEKLMGRSEFKGAYNDNVFCGRWETRF